MNNKHNGIKWTYRSKRWVAEFQGILYFVYAYKKDLWHISDKLINAVRNRYEYPEEYAKFYSGQNNFKIKLAKQVRIL